MQKKYKFGIVMHITFLVVVILSVFIIKDENLGFVLKAFCLVSFAYFILINSLATIVVTDSYVVAHRGKLGKRLELKLGRHYSYLRGTCKFNQHI